MKNFKIDRIHIVNDKSKTKANYLTDSFSYKSNLYSSKDLFILMGKDAHIRMNFKIKNR